MCLEWPEQLGVLPIQGRYACSIGQLVFDCPHDVTIKFLFLAFAKLGNAIGANQLGEPSWVRWIYLENFELAGAVAIRVESLGYSAIKIRNSSIWDSDWEYAGRKLNQWKWKICEFNRWTCSRESPRYSCETTAYLDSEPGPSSKSNQRSWARPTLPVLLSSQKKVGSGSSAIHLLQHRLKSIGHPWPAAHGEAQPFHSSSRLGYATFSQTPAYL